MNDAVQLRDNRNRTRRLRLLITDDSNPGNDEDGGAESADPMPRFRARGGNIRHSEILCFVPLQLRAGSLRAS